MAETAAAMDFGEKHGIIFGPERTGLDNDDIALASAILTFPVNPAYGSLNLAQAVLLCGYEFFKARQGGAVPFERLERSPPAQRAMTLSFFEFLEGKLDAAGFFRPEFKTSDHAAQHAQHAASHEFVPAGRAHALGRHRAPRRRPARKAAADAEADQAAEGGGGRTAGAGGDCR